MKFEFEDLELLSSTSSDLDFIIALECDPGNRLFINPWPKQKHQAAQSNLDIFHAVIIKNNERVGFLILAGLENPNRSIEFMRIIIGKKQCGIGRKALRAAKAFCFNQQRAHRLWLDVKLFNDRAKHLYLTEGFIEEGILRDCIKGEIGYESLLVLSMLETEYT